jgi:glycine cleavage system regulatory protein
MTQTQQDVVRRIQAVLHDIAMRIESLPATTTHAFYEDFQERKQEMKEETENIMHTLQERVGDVSVALKSDIDQHLDDVQERLVDLQTQINTYLWQSGNKKIKEGA